MNDATTDNLHAPPPPEHPEPAKAADELLSHGLLTFLHRDPPAETERRMKGVMRRIADEGPQHGASGRRLVFPHTRRWIALAACFVIAAGLVYLGLPAESTAQAMVRASAATLREPGDRRFEVRVQNRGSKELQSTPVGTIDSRGSDLMVMRLQPEEGVWVTFGRDPRGPWLVHPDGRLERSPSAVMMPRWGNANDQPVTPESVDRVLEDLAHAYTLVRTSEKDADMAAVEHIAGTRRNDAGPGAPRIDLWLDPKTSAVKKVEMVFPDPPSPPRGPMGGGPRGGGERGGPDGPRGDRGPRPPRDGGDGSADDRREKGPRDFDRPPPPAGEPEGRGQGGRDGHDGRGPDDFDGRGPGGGPGGPGGRGFRGGPVRIEFRPAPPPPFEPGWFTPEHHARKV